MGELRWILLGLGAVVIGIIWWWSTRRSTQAPGNAELRESTVLAAPTLSPAAADEPAVERRTAPAEARAWGVPPLEPLSIRTADFDSVPEFDQPMMVHVDSMDETFDLEAAPAVYSQDPEVEIEMEPEAATAASAAVAPATPGYPQSPPQSPPAESLSARPSPAQIPIQEAPNASEKQKIVTLRVCAVGEARWAGAQLMSTLEGHGLAFGRYQVYHRKHNDGRSVFCVASLIEPGTFDIASMANDEFRGVSIFAVLPGPLDPLQTVDALLATAKDLARELSGTVQDGRGIPFSPQRVSALREDVARFQAQLT